MSVVANLSTRIVPDIVRQHVEQATFQWAQRDTLSIEDPPDAKVVAGVDLRLEANLDALRIAGARAWPLIYAAYEDFAEKGELFLISWMAIEQANATELARAVDIGRISDDDVSRGLVGALSWHQAQTIAPFVRKWIGAPDPFKRYLGVSACCEHHVDPREMLTRLVRDPDAQVRAVSLRLAGGLKRADLVREISTQLEDGDQRVRFWAAWALTELGSGDLASHELRQVAKSGRPEASAALRAVVKAGPNRDVRAWMGSLLTDPETEALAVRGSGMLGDRTIMHWLIHHMRNPALATAAGAALLEAFPEARQADDLFTTNPSDLGQAFEEYFSDLDEKVPIASTVEAWGRSMGLLRDSPQLSRSDADGLSASM